MLAAAPANPRVAESPHHIIFASSAFDYENYAANDRANFRNRAPT
jgi:hypothetical protein